MIIMYSENEVKELANLVYHEARGESKQGQIAVAFVILNRVKSGRYGKGISEVIWAKSQFSGLKYHSGWQKFEALARNILEGKVKNPVVGMHYFKHASLGRGRLRIGNHIFW